MKNLIGISDLYVMFKGPGPICPFSYHQMIKILHLNFASRLPICKYMYVCIHFFVNEIYYLLFKDDE